MSDNHDNPTMVTKREASMLAPGEAANPVCPHCGMDPAQFRTGVTRTSAGQVLFYAFCLNRHCRKLLAINMIGQEQARVQPAGGARIFGTN